MDINQDVSITATIRDVDGNPANPTNVTFNILLPDNETLLVYDLSSPNVQVVVAGLTYRCVIDASISGFYRCRIEATNSVSDVVAVDEDTFYVAPSRV